MLTRRAMALRTIETAVDSAKSPTAFFSAVWISASTDWGDKEADTETNSLQSDGTRQLELRWTYAYGSRRKAVLGLQEPHIRFGIRINSGTIMTRLHCNFEFRS